MAGARAELRQDPAAKVGRCRMRPIVGLFPPDAPRRVRLVSKTAHDRFPEPQRGARRLRGDAPRACRTPFLSADRAGGSAERSSVEWRRGGPKSGLSGGTTGQLLRPPAHGSSDRAKGFGRFGNLLDPFGSDAAVVSRRARAGSRSDTMRPTHVAKTAHLPSHSHGGLGSERLESPSYSSLYKYIIES